MHNTSKEAFDSQFKCSTMNPIVIKIHLKERRENTPQQKAFLPLYVTPFSLLHERSW